MKLFYSWQSDIQGQKSIIEKAIKKSLKNIKREINIDVVLDKDTKNRSGAIDIAQEILNKINSASIFVGDITFVNANQSKDKYPNPNVLFELGYAVRKMGWERIILIFNKDFGEIEEVPFDLTHHRILSYSDFTELETDITAAIKLILQLGKKTPNIDRDDEHDIEVFKRIMEDVPEDNLDSLFELFVQNRWYRYDNTRFIFYTNEKIKQPKNAFINKEIQKAAYDFGNSLDVLSLFMAKNCFVHEQNNELVQLNKFEYESDYSKRYKLIWDLLNELIQIKKDVLEKFRTFRTSVGDNLGV